MTIFYSASARGFYDRATHGDRIPPDAVRITAARHRKLIDGQAAGAQILPGPDGKPILERPVATLAQFRARMQRLVKREAARRIETISPLWRQFNDIRDPSPAASWRFAAIDAVRAASDAIEDEIAAAKADELAALVITSHRLWPELPA